MHFGQFNLMGYRTPGAKAHALYDNAIEQVRTAEANGFALPGSPNTTFPIIACVPRLC